MKQPIWLIAVLVIFSITFTACANHEGSNPSQPEKIRVVLDWTPNTNHTGLYVAQAKNYFKKQGLEVQIIQPGESGAEPMVASGQADFGISFQENVTHARVQGVPIVSIATVLQHNTSGFASLDSKDIKRPRDFENKTYGGFGSPVEKQVITSLMKEDQADVDKVEMINTGNVDFFSATKKEIDFMWIYYGWTGIEAELRGEKINMIYLRDYDKALDYYTPVIITSEKQIKQNKEMVHAFMKAVSQGYQFAIDHPDQAADILLQAVPDLDPRLAKKSQAWMSPRYQADARVWGWQKEEVWSNYAKWLEKHGLLEGKFTPEEAFTNQFLPEGEK
ncbi:ABC transporter substrate-binding protein [Thermoactinomyces mirandus]|uniref:ABC transporter substrate-binding protein n=1 Tax=Thermoactinomyces mirandus TaxID=2756294 RepID=A0A7W2ARJ7_9BACL|nr:ABC transporter substrate-binding protein [Thermoactinomyces mirandus]MBA4603049.1 ABC transporter substrate-binding protein [Thermoactinomyces mirandus]